MYVYKTTNLINGKIYIGAHKSKRKFYLGSGKILKEAIKKYGKENFKMEILEKFDSESEMFEREKYWINEYDSRNPKIGYNILKGGEGGYVARPFLNKKLSDEHKQNISLHHADVSGENNPMFGKTHTNEVKDKLRNLRLGMSPSNETRKKMSIKKRGENNSNSKLTVETVKRIRVDYKSGVKTNDLAIKYGVKKPCIWKIVNNRTWKNI
jgi:group I intron endonuclease